MHPAILINEFLPDPVGADKGWEWIELVNLSEEEGNLSNWEIQIAGVKYNRAFKFPTDSKILPGQYLLICEEFVENCHYYTTQLAIQNGGKETDGVRILNENLQVIDTVLYDTTNSNNLLNDFGDIEKDENIVEMPPAGCSLSRKSFSDTNGTLYYLNNCEENILRVGCHELFKEKNGSPAPNDLIDQCFEVDREIIETDYYTSKVSELKWSDCLNHGYHKGS